MAQTKEGAIKINAQKCGITVEEYNRQVASGLKWCYKCKTWKSTADYVKDRTRYDGLMPICKTCRNAKTPYASLKGRVSTFKGHKHTPESLAKMSAALKGKQTRLGKKHTVEARKKMSETKRLRGSAPKGERAHSYKDGKLAERRGQRFSQEYKRWRFDVFSRDNFTCQDCGDNRGGNLVAHHIKEFADFPELRFEVSNGLTLCETCHNRRHFKPDSTRNLAKARKARKQKEVKNG